MAGVTRVDAFAEAEALVDGFGPRPPGSDAERAAADHLADRLEAIGRRVELETFSVWPRWALGYAINAGIGVVGSVVAVSNATLGTLLVLLATALTFLDLSGVTPTTRRLLGRRESQNVISWSDDEEPRAVVLVAHYDSGPTRRRPLRPLFLALVAVLACCVLRAGGLSGTLLTVLQFIPTVGLILYVALLLDIALSPAAPGENDNASGVAVVLRLAERLGDVHVLFTGSEEAMAQGTRAFLKVHRPGALLNVDAVGSGELRTEKHAAGSVSVPSLTLTATGVRLEEHALTEAEELCVELIERLDGELS